MAKLIRAVAWRRLERPYTRKSKYRKHNYVRSVPNNKIVKFDMGNLTADFPATLYLKSGADIQIRHNALEAARQTTNRFLEKKLGKQGFHLKVRVYPHHILRNNPLAAGAGADRMSTGMSRSFGKAVGIAARVRKGQILFQLDVPKEALTVAKEALRRAKNKMPCSCSIEVIEKKETENKKEE